MEGIYSVLECYRILYTLFFNVWSECSWRCLVRFDARNSTLFHYFLYMDFESEVYKEAKEMDVGNDGYHFVLLDSLSSADLRYSGRSRISCSRSVGYMYRYVMVSLY